MSFLALVVTQFLVSFNDNIFRWLVIPIGKEYVGQDLALGAGSILFLLPFVVLAAPAGYLADRFSKRNVMIGCKVAEIVIMTLGIVVILGGNIYLMLIVLFFMGGQSTMFSPSKYGSIPEIVREDRISAANGVIALTTMLAVISGTLVGGYLFDWTTPPSVLVVDEDPDRRESLGEFVKSLGFRPKRAQNMEEALDAITSGAPKVVLLDDRLPKGDPIESSIAIRKTAGGVAVLVMTDDPTLQKAAEAKEGGLNGYLAKPIDLDEVKAAIRKWAGPGEPLVAEQEVLPGQLHWWRSGATLIGVALVGWIASLFIGRLRPANPSRRFPFEMAGQTFRDLRTLATRRPLLLASLASAYFWALGLLANVNVDKFARPELVTDQQHVGWLLGILMLGIGIGSALAGIWSAGKVELGLVPIGAFGMALVPMLLATVPEGVGSPFSVPYVWTCLWALAMGCFAGLYDIPLMSYLQHRSPRRSRGVILAANNFLSFSAMLLAAGLFWLMAGSGMSARQIWLVAGITTVPVFLCIMWMVFDRAAFVVVRGFSRMLCRMRVAGLENVPEEGGALLAASRGGWFDAILLLLSSPRPVRLLVRADYLKRWPVSRLARDFRVIPMGSGHEAVARSIREARNALAQGELVCVFPEDHADGTEASAGLSPGGRAVVKGTGAPVVPVYFGESGEDAPGKGTDGKSWPWPFRRPFRASISFGLPTREVLPAE
ncbi:MAG: MFS transporter [Planctomycetota bacterium]